ncbi:hypothetical protein H9P43_004218 [Blastocladiella emersonii ATCC 22665]|nr:hypothetical protein H9P43_004218 [Blastocladiella emersonii ATCC 22665]
MDPHHTRDDDTVPGSGQPPTGTHCHIHALGRPWAAVETMPLPPMFPLDQLDANVRSAQQLPQGGGARGGAGAGESVGGPQRHGQVPHAEAMDPHASSPGHLVCDLGDRSAAQAARDTGGETRNVAQLGDEFAAKAQIQDDAGRGRGGGRSDHHSQTDPLPGGDESGGDPRIMSAPGSELGI